MKFYWLLFLVIFLPQKTFSKCLLFNAPPTVNNNPDSLRKIDKMNADAYDMFLADPVAARKLAENALIRSKTIVYQNGIGHAFFNIAVSYWAQSYYQVSLLYIDTAIRYLPATDRVAMSNCYRMMGRDYADLKDFPTALLFLQKAEKEAGNDKYLLEEVISERSHIYARLHQYPNALLAVHKALVLSRQIKNTSTEAILYGRLTSIYCDYDDNKNNALAARYVDTAITMSFTSNNKRLRSSCFLSKAQILLDEGDLASAIIFAEKAMGLADSLGIMDFTARSYKIFINIYSAKGDAAKVSFYQKKYNDLLQHLNLVDRQNSAALIQNYFELNTRLQKVQQDQQGNQVNRLIVKSQQKVIGILVVSLCLLIVVLYTVYYFYQQKTKLVKALGEQNIAVQQQSQVIELQAKHLDDLNNLKNKLLMVIGHDLRGPIGNLRNITDLFENGALTDEETRGIMKGINPVVKGAELTLTNLLQWANNQIKGGNVVATEVTLLPVVEETKQTFDYLIDQKHIKFVNKVTNNISLHVDESHLKVVFRNMLSNAIKFTSDGGCIAVDAWVNDGLTVVSIQDTGVGLSAEDIDRIWANEVHFSRSGTMGEMGTGIGLQLCRELIELNQGKIWVQSTAKKGTTFYFSLPAK